MEAVYFLFGLLAIVGVPVLFVAGMIRPSRFDRIFKDGATRTQVTLFSVAAFIVFITGSMITEPASVRQARLSEQRQSSLSQPAETTNTNDYFNDSHTPKPEVTDLEEPVVSDSYKERHYWHKVVRVVDGDTVRIMIDGKDESVRIIGINAPESTSKTECFGSNATNKAKEILQTGWVQLERDNTQPDRDKYNRLLRYIWAGDGSVDLGYTMIHGGYAHEYTYRVPHNKQELYRAAQHEAESATRGLWAKDTCNGQKVAASTKPSTPKVTVSPPVATSPKPQSSSSRPAPTSGVVKKSKSDICHAPGTTYYNRTKNYTAYNSLQACLNSGGRLPKR